MIDLNLTPIDHISPQSRRFGIDGYLNILVNLMAGPTGGNPEARKKGGEDREIATLVSIQTKIFDYVWRSSERRHSRLPYSSRYSITDRDVVRAKKL